MRTDLLVCQGWLISSVSLASLGLSPIDQVPESDRLALNLFGRDLSNPLGLAAGFDKNGEAVDAMFNLGFGLVGIVLLMSLISYLQLEIGSGIFLGK